LWAFIQPLVTLFVFTLLFGRGIQVNTGGVPYPIFALAGMSAWSYFSFVMAQAGNSIIGSGDIIKKTYFPRLVIPLSKALVGFVDFSVTLFFLAVLMIFYRFALPPQIIWLPFFVMATVLCGLTIGIWLSAMTIRFRDFQHVIPFLVQLGMYATPVAYPSSLIPHKFIAIYYLNPMAVTVEGFRWAITGVDAPQPLAYLSLVGVGILFVLGLRYFRKVELVMADLV
jgi:lipopolysaccharide transport system permease protein